MSDVRVSLHDAEVMAVETRRDIQQLLLKLRMPGGTDAFLEFLGVEDVFLGPFCEQNVLFDLDIWSASREGTLERCRELELPSRCSDAILAAELVLYELDSSVGLAGHVLATAARWAEGREGGTHGPFYDFR